MNQLTVSIAHAVAVWSSRGPCEASGWGVAGGCGSGRPRGLCPVCRHPVAFIPIADHSYLLADHRKGARTCTTTRS